MLNSNKILMEVIALQAHYAQGLKKATTLRATLEEELNPSPRSLRRTELVSKAVQDRDRRLKNRSV